MKRIATLGLLLAGIAACAPDAAEEATPAADATATVPAATMDTAMAPGTAGAAGAGQATAMMRDSTGAELGRVTLTETPQGIQVSGQLRGVPAGEHGFHIHTTGSCEPTFEAAGGHWNPTNAQHGFEVQGGPHFGDMRNITVGADGSITAQGTTAGGTLQGQNGLLDADGAAVMIHANPDDYKSQPSGDAGARVACGVVQMGA